MTITMLQKQYSALLEHQNELHGKLLLANQYAGFRGSRGVLEAEQARLQRLIADQQKELDAEKVATDDERRKVEHEKSQLETRRLELEKREAELNSGEKNLRKKVLCALFFLFLICYSGTSINKMLWRFAILETACLIQYLPHRALQSVQLAPIVLSNIVIGKGFNLFRAFFYLDTMKTCKVAQASPAILLSVILHYLHTTPALLFTAHPKRNDF